jgi:hypothetical protein
VSKLGRVQDLVRRLELQLRAASSDAASVDLCSRLVHELVALTDRSIGMACSPDLAAHFHLPAATASPLSDPLPPRPAAGMEVPTEELASWIPGGEVVRQGALREDVLPHRRRAWTWSASSQRRLALLLEVSSAASSSSLRSPVWIRSMAPCVHGARVYFLGDKKTINPKIVFLGWERFFILPPKNRSNQLILPHQLSKI